MINSSSSPSILALLAFGSIFAPEAASAAGYSLTWLGVESGYTRSSAVDVNNSGEVVGSSSNGGTFSANYWFSVGALMAFSDALDLTDPSKFDNYDYAFSGIFAAINNSGTVAVHNDSFGGFALWSAGSDVVEVISGFSYPTDINDAGQISGIDGLWDPVDGAQGVSGWTLYGYGINSLGQIVGIGSGIGGGSESTIFFDASDGTFLAYSYDVYGATLYALNDSGLAVGGGSGSPVIWTASDGFTAIAAFADGTAVTAGSFESVSSSGAAVGSANDGGGYTPVIWTAEDGMIDLNTMIAGGGVLTRATAISDNGQYIVGYGVQEGTSYYQAFLLTATSDVPLPAGAVLLPAALAGLAAFRRRAA